MPSTAYNEPPQQPVGTGTMQDVPGLINHDAYDIAPNLPHIQLVSRKQSFVDLFTTSFPQAGERTSLARPISSPGPERNSKFYTGSLDKPNTSHGMRSWSKSPTDSHTTITGKSFLMSSKQFPLRHTSSDSSTSRSKGSDGSPPSSRPSSRSSVDDDLIGNYAYPKSAPAVASERGIAATTLGPPPGFEVAPRKSPKIRATIRSHSVPARVSHKNKPLPPMPHEVEAASDLSSVEPLASSLTHAAVQAPVKSKRGARLGRQMVARSLTGTQSSDTIGLPWQRHIKSETASIKVSQRIALSISPTTISPRLLQGSKLSSSTPDRIYLRIMSYANNLDDLQSMAMVNRGFNATFYRYEKELVSRALFKYSLPAWELRQIMKCEQKRGAFRLRSAQKDMATIRAIRSFILMKCESICRPSTVQGLLGRNLKSMLDVENALWRTWIFCKLFGRKKFDDQSFATQLLWLNGGKRQTKDEKNIALGVGNGAGLSVKELEDLSEIWSCLGALLAEFKDREAEAKRAGVFDLCVFDEDAEVTERSMLNEWIYHILALGPKAVLTLVTCSFDQAKVLGITNWTPPEQGQTKATFFKAAIEHVYRERLVSDARSKAMEFEKSRIRSMPRRAVSDSLAALRPVTSGISLKALTDKRQPDLPPVIAPKGLRVSTSQAVRPDCDPHSTSQSRSSINCSTPNTPVFSSFAITTGASARLGASLFPFKSVQQQSQETSHQRQIQSTNHNSMLHVIDPVDRAMHYLVEQCNYPMNLVQRALAMSDDGRGVDVALAVEIMENKSATVKDKVYQGICELPACAEPKLPPFDRAAPRLPNTFQPLPPNPYKGGQRGPGRTTKRGSSQLGVILDDEEEEEDGSSLPARRESLDRHVSDSESSIIGYRSSPSLTPQPLRFSKKMRMNFRPHSSSGFMQRKSPNPQNRHFSAEYGMSGKILQHPNQRVSMAPKSTNIGLGMCFTDPATAAGGKGIYRTPSRLFWTSKENVRGLGDIAEKSQGIGRAY